ncbi:hypothetical protein ABPG77_001592 [Micractinium sp. CCAP 211/92]
MPLCLQRLPSLFLTSATVGAALLDGVDEKNSARWRLAGVFALTLGTTGVSVMFNYLDATSSMPERQGPGKVH